LIPSTLRCCEERASRGDAKIHAKTHTLTEDDEEVYLLFLDTMKGHAAQGFIFGVRCCEAAPDHLDSLSLGPPVMGVSFSINSVITPLLSFSINSVSLSIAAPSPSLYR
jgi:hypothetical protein